MSLTTQETLRVSLFSGPYDNRPKQQAWSWAELCATLTTHRELGRKDWLLWSPAEYPRHQAATRSNANVATVSCLVMDFDNGVTHGELACAWSRYAYVIYSSFNSKPDHEKWRVVFPLVRPISGGEWPAVWTKIALRLGDGNSDPSCKDPARMYYLPAHPVGGSERAFTALRQGGWLDPDDFPDLPPVERPRAPLGGAPSRVQGTGDYTTLDAVRWFDHHGCYGADLGNGKHSVRCPWESEHTEQKDRPEADTDTCVWEAEGKVWPQFHCLHNHCRHRRTADVMMVWGDADRFCTAEFEGARTLKLKTPEPQVNVEDLEKARAFALSIEKELEKDAGCAFGEEALWMLGLLRAVDKPNWMRARAVLVRKRVGIRELENSLPPVADYLPKDQLPQRRAGDTVDDCPSPELVVPPPYYVENGETGRWVTDDDGDSRKATIAYAPVVVSGRTRDDLTGTESLLLAWRWPRAKWQSRIVERASALAGRELVKLAGVGFPVADDNSKDLVGYLHRLEAANRPALPCAKVSSHLGWQGEPGKSAFLCGRRLVLPTGDIETADALNVEHPEEWSEERVCFHAGGEGQDQVVDAFHSLGKLENWLQAVAVLADFPKALLVFYAALAPPLLPIFGVPNFIVDLSHDTTVGKSTALRAAASHWGSPDERTACSLIQTWDATRVGLERISEVLSCLPLFVDDTKKAKNRRMVADLIYAVVSGRGRVRGSVKGLAHTAAWRTIMFSTGEEPATAFTEDGGTRTRVLTVRGIPFGSQNAQMARVTGVLNEQVCRHCGHSGPMFLSWLQKHREHWPVWRERYDALIATYSQAAAKIPEAGRLAAYVALITIAGEMAHQALPLPWKFSDPAAALWGDLSGEAADAAGSVRALEEVFSWASSHEHQFIGRFPKGNEYQDRLPPVVLGRWDEDGEYLAIYPSILRETLIKAGYSYTATLSGWRERGWLKHRQSIFTHDVPISRGTDTRKMVCILNSAIETLNYSEE